MRKIMLTLFIHIYRMNLGSRMAIILILFTILVGHFCGETSKGQDLSPCEQEIQKKAISIIEKPGAVCYYNAPSRYSDFLQDVLRKMKIPQPEKEKVTDPKPSDPIRWVSIICQQDENVFARQMEAIGTLKYLQTLRIFDSALSDDNMEHLADCSRLEYLYIQHYHEGDLTLNGLKYIGRLPQLRRLVLIGLPVPKGFFAEIARCKKLEDIEFHYCTFEDESLGSIGKLKSLKSLYLFRKFLSSRSLVNIARCKKLLVVYFQKCTLEDGTLEPISELPLLQKIIMYDIAISDQELERLASIKNLDILLNNGLDVWKKIGSEILRYRLSPSDDPFWNPDNSFEGDK